MTLVFMHIPKTAGTSLSAGLEAAMAPEVPIRGLDRSLFGGFDGYDGFAGEVARQLYRSADALPPDAGFVLGHFACSTLRAAYPGGRMATVLREPATRLLSHWMYWRRTPDEELVDWAGWGDLVRLARRPLRTFLADPALASQTDNLTVRALLWPHALIPDDGFIAPRHDRRLYREARARLRGFDFVDLVENDGLVDRLAGWLRRPFALPRLNETVEMPPALRSPIASELCGRSLALLDLRSRVDLRLWSEFATRRLGWRDVREVRRRVILSAVARCSAVMAA